MALVTAQFYAAVMVALLSTFINKSVERGLALVADVFHEDNIYASVAVGCILGIGVTFTLPTLLGVSATMATVMYPVTVVGIAVAVLAAQVVASFVTSFAFWVHGKFFKNLPIIDVRPGPRMGLVK